MILWVKQVENTKLGSAIHVVTIVRDFCAGRSSAQFSVPASVNRLCGVEVVGCHH